MSRKYFFLFSLFFCISFGYAQRHFIPTPEDKPIPCEKHLLIATDLMQYGLLEPNLGIEYRITRRSAFGLYAGLIYPDKLFYVNPLANGQYTLPGTVYNGNSLHFYYKYYRIRYPEGHSPNDALTYWSAQIDLKNEWYNNVQFLDKPYGDEIQITYNMNEKCLVTGLDILNGYELFPQSMFSLDLFWGLGIHIRFRNFDVISENSSFANYLPLGNYKGYVAYPTPVLGAKIGFKFLRKLIPTPEVKSLPTVEEKQ